MNTPYEATAVPDGHLLLCFIYWKQVTYPDGYWVPLLSPVCFVTFAGILNLTGCKMQVMHVEISSR